jgi:hypothetical protein
VQDKRIRFFLERDVFWEEDNFNLKSEFKTSKYKQIYLNSAADVRYYKQMKFL